MAIGAVVKGIQASVTVRSDGSIVGIDGELERLLGWSGDDLVDIPLLVLVHPRDASNAAGALNEPGGCVSCRLLRHGGGWVETLIGYGCESTCGDHTVVVRPGVVNRQLAAA